MFSSSRWINWHRILSCLISVSYWPFSGGARDWAGTMGMFRGHFRFFYWLLGNWVKICFPNQSQLRSTAWSIKICTQTALFVFFFLIPAAEIMFNTLFNIILKTKPGNTERRRRKKRTKKGPSRPYSRRVSRPVSYSAPQRLTWVTLIKNRVLRGLLRYTNFP